MYRRTALLSALRISASLLIFCLSLDQVHAQGLLPTDRDLYESIPSRAEIVRNRRTSSTDEAVSAVTGKPDGAVSSPAPPQAPGPTDPNVPVRPPVMSDAIVQSPPFSSAPPVTDQNEDPAAVSADLPESIDLRPFLPPPGKQEKNDCVAWAIAYASYSCQICQERGYDRYTGRDADTFNPDYIYSELSPDGKPMNVFRAARHVILNGCASLATMPWKSAQRSKRADREADTLRAVSLTRAENLNDIQQFLADGYPVILAVYVDDTFHSKASGTEPYRWTPGGQQYRHAVCAVGYDRKSGTVLIMNSYGTDWKDGGFCKVSDKEFDMINDQHWCSEAYVLEVRRIPPITVQMKDTTRRTIFGRTTMKRYQLRSDNRVYEENDRLSPEAWSVEELVVAGESLYILRNDHKAMKLNPATGGETISWSHLDRGPLQNQDVVMMSAVPGSDLHALTKDGALYRLRYRSKDWADWEAVHLPSPDSVSRTVIDLRDDGTSMTVITNTGDIFKSSSNGQWAVTN
ncbi:MAG: C1 family peptidase [Planctomycetaceae bacterium]